MSYIFDAGDETLWSPALRIGQTYVGLAGQLGALLGVPTGLHQLADDMVDIDVDAFQLFTRALLDEHLRSAHPIHRALTQGTLVVSLALLDRTGRPLEPLSQEETDLVRQAREYGASMPS